MTTPEQRAAARRRRVALVLALALSVAALAVLAWFAAQGATPA